MTTLEAWEPQPGDLAEIRLHPTGGWHRALMGSDGCWTTVNGRRECNYGARRLRVAGDDEVILPRDVAAEAAVELGDRWNSARCIQRALDAQKSEPEPLRWPDGEPVEVGQLVSLWTPKQVGRITHILRPTHVGVEWLDGAAVANYELNALTRFTRPDVPTTLDSRVKCDDGSEWVLMDPEGLAGWARLPWDSTHTNWRSSDWIAQHIITVEREGVE